MPHSASRSLKPVLRTRLVAALGLGLTLTTAWAGAASYYLIFHDEMLARFVSRQSAMQYTYEERLDTLQRALDRATSDHTATRSTIETRLSTLAERQAVIERRQGILTGLPGAAAESDVATTGSIPSVEPPPMPTRPQKPFPTPELRMHSGEWSGGRAVDRAENVDTTILARLARLERSLDHVAERQSRAVARVAQRAGDSADRFRNLIARTGLNPARFEPAIGGVGGPLVPLPADGFETSLAEARRQIEDETHLRRVTAALPFRQPLPGEIAYTSSFGTRLDPFTRAMALHTGVDMRAEIGAPARATAAGRVTAAEYAGGYGNMVEVDHGRGLVTRYAHLSGTAVSVGQRVEAGTVIGFVGSTGRSTGSHLHYETRIDGEPVDPQRFLRAGSELVFAD
ncbi:M23 family metallopeptidase [Methylorubrum sp. POS3]|uniref:M23 family metallopeptidase n=1 Tax=Methylorubrum sp. POS3 TaxID=2998492 RepID=UPI00372A6A54